jgi:hypothetical protein
MVQIQGLGKIQGIIFFIGFFGLMTLSVWISYQQLLVGRQYQIFYTEEEAETANIGLYGLVKEMIYGTNP